LEILLLWILGFVDVSTLDSLRVLDNIIVGDVFVFGASGALNALIQIIL